MKHLSPAARLRTLSVVVIATVAGCSTEPPPSPPREPEPVATAQKAPKTTAGIPAEAAAPATAAVDAGTTVDAGTLTATSATATKKEPVAYASVQTIFERSCYRCHGARKHKGDLRLHEKAAAMQGGEHGAVIVPGDAKKSKLYRSITLPRGHEDYMPAKGDPLSDDEIALIGRWIDEGAAWPD
jgi:mono/diheme cytochrome c family protein